MKNIVVQLFTNKHIILKNIEKAQSNPQGEWNTKEINALHDELDRTNHLIEMFFGSVGL